MSKRIWLIGASEGIGAALARALARKGAALALSARSGEALTALAAGLAAPAGAAPLWDHIVAPLDARSLDSVTAAWQRIDRAWGGVDMLIYCAGAYTPLGAQDYDLTRIETMVDTNLGGALRALSFVLPRFRDADAGHIVLFGSIAGYRGLPRALGYGLSKAALIHLAENLKVDLADTHIKVQLVCPGFVKTRLTDKNDFPMPFLISPDAAAAHIVAGLARERFEIHFPKPMTLAFKLIQALPYALYFRFARAFLSRS